MQGYEIEPSVQMRLYSLNKRQFVLVFVTFFVCFAITVLIGLAGPPITESTVRNSTSLSPPPANLKSGPFIIKSPEVSTFNQQLWVSVRLHIKHKGVGTFSQPFEMGILIRGLLEDDNPSRVYSEGSHNRSRLLRCSGDSGCDDIILLHLGYLDCPSYVFTVHLYGLEVEVTEVEFVFQMYNSSFTQLEIWFRFVFLVLTFLATCAFAHTLRKFSMRDWSIEQKWMSVLLPLLLLYDNPIFPLTFLVDSWIPSLFDAIFQATFLGALLLFWLCLYHGVRQIKRRCLTFYMPKLLIVGLIWIAAVTLSSWQSYNTLQDPTYDYRIDTGNFLGFKIFFFTVAGLYVLYLVYLLVRAYAELRSMPYFDLRLKFMTALMLIVLAISIAITVLRFGTGMLQDNFVAEMSTHYQNSAEFMAFYGLLNFYMYTMAFVYSPSKNAVYESHFKDNPALSMLNDSDDEIVYGSDHEETALARKSSVRSYDSDEEAFN